MNKLYWFISPLVIAWMILVIVALDILLKEVRKLLGTRFDSFIEDKIVTAVSCASQRYISIINSFQNKPVQCLITIIGQYETYGPGNEKVYRWGTIGAFFELTPGQQQTHSDTPYANFTAHCWHLSAPLDCYVEALTFANESVMVAPGVGRFGLLNHKLSLANRYSITVKRQA